MDDIASQHLKNELTKALMVNAQIMTQLLRITADYETEKKTSAFLREELQVQGQVLTKYEKQIETMSAKILDVEENNLILKNHSNHSQEQWKEAEERNAKIRTEFLKIAADYEQLKTEFSNLVNTGKYVAIDSRKSLDANLKAPDKAPSISQASVLFDNFIAENAVLPKAPKKIIAQASQNACTALSFDRTSSKLFAALGDSVKLFDLNGRARTTFSAPQCCSLSVKDDNKMLLACSADSNGYLFWCDGREKHEILANSFVGHSDKLVAGMFLESNRVLTASKGEFKVWDIETGGCLKSKSFHSSFYCVSSCHDNMIASAHFDRTVRVWDYDSGELLYEIADLHPHRITSIEFSPDGNSILTNSRDSIVRELDARKRQIVTEYLSPKYVNTYTMNRAIYAPNGKYIVVGSALGAVLTWKPNSQKAHIVEAGVAHSKPIYSIAYNNSGSLLATSDEVGVICLWD